MHRGIAPIQWDLGLSSRAKYREGGGWGQDQGVLSLLTDSAQLRSPSLCLGGVGKYWILCIVGCIFCLYDYILSLSRCPSGATSQFLANNADWPERKAVMTYE